MAEFLTLTIGEETFRFHTRNQLIDWWGKERTHWQWLWESTGRREFNSTRDIANQLNATIATADPSELVEDLERFFSSSGAGAPYSNSVEGQRALNAFHLAGPEAAGVMLVAERFPQTRANLFQAANAHYNFSRGASASFAGFGADREAMGAERRNYRNAIGRLEQRVRDLEGEKDDYIRLRAGRAARLTRRLMQRSSAIWNEAATEFETKRNDALKTIADTEEKYRFQMALQAPVEYWKAKAKTHGKWEIAWAATMIVYFVTAALGIFEIAQWASEKLLAVPQNGNATPIYIIISGATLGATTLIFWIGRLVSKLFLSEHHLRADSREKSIMTQAFLSMETREQFSSEERAIILASIFRLSPDGIVKDEGPADLGLPALLARLVNPAR